MLVSYSSVSSAIERIKAIMNDKDSERQNILFKFNTENSTARVAYSDGRRAVCSEIDITLEDGEEVDEDIIAPYKQICDAIEMAKPAGILQVDDIEIVVDTEHKHMKFTAEKFILQADENGAIEKVDNPEVAISDEDAELAEELDAELEAEDETAEEESNVERKVIATLSRAFKYFSAEDDRRYAALLRPDYTKMLGVHEAGNVGEVDGTSGTETDVWNRQELISVLSKVASEDDKQVIMSGAKHTVNVSNMNYAVTIPREEVVHPLCMNVKLAKNIMDVFKRSGVEDISILIEDVFCTVCGDDGKVAFWFESEKPMRRVLNTIDGYNGLEFDAYCMVLVRDAILNIVKCCGDAADVTLKFKGNQIDGIKLKVSGGDTASKANEFEIEPTELTGKAYGDIENAAFKVNTDTIRKMIELCSSPYILMEFAVGEAGEATVRVSDAHKEGGIVHRELSSFAPVIAKTA